MPAKQPSINLLGQEEMQHTPLGRIVTWAVTYGRYIMIGTEIVVLLAFISRFSLDRKLTDLKEEIGQKQTIIEANLAFEQDVRNLQNRLAQIKKLLASQSNPGSLLTTIHVLLPQDVYLQSLDITKDKLRLTAVAGSTQGFSQLIANLQNSRDLLNVEIGEVKRHPVLGLQFSLTAQIPVAAAAAK